MNSVVHRRAATSVHSAKAGTCAGGRDHLLYAGEVDPPERCGADAASQRWMAVGHSGYEGWELREEGVAGSVVGVEPDAKMCFFMIWFIPS
jgi:hypothetical protein